MDSIFQALPDLVIDNCCSFSEDTYLLIPLMAFILDRRVEELGECQRKVLKVKLDLESDGINNWKEVAEYFRVPTDAISAWKTKAKAGGSPTEGLLYFLISKNVNITELLICLVKLERYDASDTLIRHLTEKCCICARRESPPDF